MTLLTDVAAVLAWLYPGRDHARRVALDAEVDPEAVDLDGPANLRWFRILEEAAKLDKVERLLAIARDEYPAQAAKLTISFGPASKPRGPAQDSRAPSEAAHRLRILHLSDLHERIALPWMTERRRKLVALRASDRHRVLMQSNLQDVLQEIHGSQPIDLVCFTGDVADWGLREEYELATQRVRTLLDWCGTSMDRLFVVPGNHDVERSVGKRGWSRMRRLSLSDPNGVSDWCAGLGAPSGARADWLSEVGRRTEPFWRWVSEGLSRPVLSPEHNPHGRLGYRVAFRKPGCSFDVHLIGLDSAWLCGDDNDARKICVTEGQLRRLTRDDDGRPLEGFRIALVHHPLSDLADEKPAFMHLSETTDLLLHGHQHSPLSEAVVDPDRRLRIMAAGALYEGDRGDKWINSFQVIDATLAANGRPLKFVITFWGWSAQGHWHRSGAMYRAAPFGTMEVPVSTSAE